MATRSSIKCPWRQFYKHVIKYMDSLHAEPCEPQMKIDTFVHAIRHSFPSPTMDLEKHKKSTKQMQTTEQPRKIAQDPSSSTKRTANTETIDTDSAYYTETESSYTPQMENTKFSPLQDHTKNITRPSTSRQSITIIEEEISSTQDHQPKPNTSTWSNTETTIKQPTVPAPRSSTACTHPQHTRKTPLLPTPPASTRNFNYSNHFKQCISRPSAFNNRNPTFTRPSPFYNRFYNQHISEPSPSRYNTYPTFSGPANYRYYPQPHIPRPSCQHQNFFTRPHQQHQQPQGHCTQQPYVPILILTPYNQLNNVLAHQTKLFNLNQQ